MQDWTQDDEFLTTMRNPRMTYSEKLLNGSPDKVIRTEFTYAPLGDYSGNLKETREYSYAGALRRKTLLNYLHETNGAYVPLNIIDRVAESYVYDGGNNLVAKTVTGYDEFSLYPAPNAIRHDPAYGTGYLTRGLATTVTRWYDLVNNYTIATTNGYDECGNARELRDGRNYVTFIEYWLSSADNAYTFPLRTTNAKSQVTQAMYSYRSGVVLSQTDANGRTTTMTYDNSDRITGIDRPDLKAGPEKTFTYAGSVCEHQQPAYAVVTSWLTDSTNRQTREQVNLYGQLKETTVTDAAGNIITEQDYGEWGQTSSVTTPHREGATVYTTGYGYSGPRLASMAIPSSGTRWYSYSANTTTVTNTDGRRRRYTYQEDGKVSQVLEEDSGGQLTIATDYAYDTMGRLITITQGIQTRAFTYDAIGRLKTEVHPESGTTVYIYDANGNVLTKTDARGIVTTTVYDELNRPTQRSYSDGTPAVTFTYDAQPGGSPIAINNPVGRLAKSTTTTSGVTVSHYYSYCSCATLERESTVITDGTTRTYTTSYAYNYQGETTSITYPNGK